MQSAVTAGRKPAGVILAGGRSRRMSGVPKALLDLDGQPLLKHVINRVSAQVDDLCLSVEQPSAALAEFGLPLVADPQPDAGPLAGLLMGLRLANPGNEWLLLVPCDAPFLPLDLADRLLEYAITSALPGAVAVYGSEIQPTFSIWNRRILPQIEKAFFEQQMTGFKQVLRVLEVARLEWPRSKPPPFFNINDRDALHEAGRLIESQSGKLQPCSA